MRIVHTVIAGAYPPFLTPVLAPEGSDIDAAVQLSHQHEVRRRELTDLRGQPIGRRFVGSAGSVEDEAARGHACSSMTQRMLKCGRVMVSSGCR
jgi:hypothetical protein